MQRIHVRGGLPLQGGDPKRDQDLQHLDDDLNRVVVEVAGFCGEGNHNLNEDPDLLCLVLDQDRLVRLHPDHDLNRVVAAEEVAFGGEGNHDRNLDPDLLFLVLDQGHLVPLHLNHDLDQGPDLDLDLDLGQGLLHVSGTVKYK